MPVAPAEKIANRPVVRHAGVLVADGGREIGSYLGTNSKIQFQTSDRLTVDKAASFGLNVGSATAAYAGPLLLNFLASDTIDLKEIATAGLGLNYSAASGILQLTQSGKVAAALAFQNSTLGAGAFHVTADGSGGTLVFHS